MKVEQLNELASVCMKMGIKDILLPRSHKPEGEFYSVVNTEVSTSSLGEAESFQVGGVRFHYLKEQTT